MSGEGTVPGLAKQVCPGKVDDSVARPFNRALIVQPFEPFSSLPLVIPLP
jgi:hypothetical protein